MDFIHLTLQQDVQHNMGVHSNCFNRVSTSTAVDDKVHYKQIVTLRLYETPNSFPYISKIFTLRI